MRDPEEVKEWIKKADDDFEGAVDISRRRKNPLPDLVCFHCQQSAEKYLKAFLIFKETAFPKTHDLLLLLESCKNHHPNFELNYQLFEFLNPYSVQFRYPGEEATPEEAKLALRKLKEIRKIMRDVLPENLFVKG